MVLYEPGCTIPFLRSKWPFTVTRWTGSRFSPHVEFTDTDVAVVGDDNVVGDGFILFRQVVRIGVVHGPNLHHCNSKNTRKADYSSGKKKPKCELGGCCVPLHAAVCSCCGGLGGHVLYFYSLSMCAPPHSTLGNSCPSPHTRSLSSSKVGGPCLGFKRHPTRAHSQSPQLLQGTPPGPAFLQHQLPRASQLVKTRVCAQQQASRIGQ